MHQRRIGLLAGIVGAAVAFQGPGYSQNTLLDDFEDGDDAGWEHVEAPGIFEVVNGRYRLATPDAIPVGPIGGFVTAKLTASEEPQYSDGYFRAKIHANTMGTSMNMTLRASFNSVGLSFGYNFYANSALGEIGVERLGGPYQLLGSISNSFKARQTWTLEAGVVGNVISMRAWKEGDVEPSEPQLTVRDATYAQGSFVLLNMASFHALPTIVDGVWDDITFRPGIPPEAFAEATPSVGIAPLPVRLSAEGSPECEDVRYHWTLPDGETLDGPEVDHVFVEAGRHVVKLAIESDNGCCASTSVTVLVQPTPGNLDPWQASIIGMPAFGVAGHATQDESGTSLDLYGGGRRLTGTSDAFGFVHRQLDCDGVLVARIDDIVSPKSRAQQIGLQMRESLGSGARHASMILEISQAGGGKLLFLHRLVVASASIRGSETPDIAEPIWIKLERRGDVISGASSTIEVRQSNGKEPSPEIDSITYANPYNGTNWTDAGSSEFLGLGPTLLAGVVAIGNEPASPAVSFLLPRARLSGVDLRCEAAPAFRRGDANGDGTVDLSDAVATFGYLFLGGQAPACTDAEDADDSGVLDVSDGIFTLGYLFGGTSAPPLPGPTACGPDVEADDLGPCLYPACL